MWGFIFGKAVSIRDAIIRGIKSIVPPHVHNVWHIDSLNRRADGQDFNHLYKGSQYTWNWHRSHHTTMFAPHTGFYVLQTWNSERKYMNCHFFSAQTLSYVLQSKTLSTWWAFSDFGICTMIASYFVSNKPDMQRIFAILIDGKDVTTALKPFMSSIVISKNLTASSVCDLYYSFIKKIHHKKYSEDTITLVDFNLEERIVKGGDLLFPS